jgi:YHS domain-containing protein
MGKDRIDPVCKMKIAESEVKYISEHEGEEVCFCSKECKLEFEKHPAEYLILPSSPG